MLSVLPIIFIWRFHRVAQDQRILDSELDTEVTYHKISMCNQMVTSEIRE